jgi:hypothetical protein
MHRPEPLMRPHTVSRALLAWSAALLTSSLGLLASGCLTHLPPAGHGHMAIHWGASYEAACDEAARTHRPLLVLLVAGEIDGLC